MKDRIKNEEHSFLSDKTMLEGVSNQAALTAISGMFSGIAHVLSQHVSVLGMAISELERASSGEVFSQSELQEIFGDSNIALKESGLFLRGISRAARSISKIDQTETCDAVEAFGVAALVLQGWANLFNTQIEVLGEGKALCRCNHFDLQFSAILMLGGICHLVSQRPELRRKLTSIAISVTRHDIDTFRVDCDLEGIDVDTLLKDPFCRKGINHFKSVVLRAGGSAVFRDTHLFALIPSA